MKEEESKTPEVIYVSRMSGKVVKKGYPNSERYIRDGSTEGLVGRILVLDGTPIMCTVFRILKSEGNKVDVDTYNTIDTEKKEYSNETLNNCAVHRATEEETEAYYEAMAAIIDRQRGGKQ